MCIPAYTGKKILEFQQSRELGIYLQLMQVVSPGVCASLCYYYLKTKIAGESFTDWIADGDNKVTACRPYQGGAQPGDYMSAIWEMMKESFKLVHRVEDRPFHAIFSEMLSSETSGNIRFILFKSKNDATPMHVVAVYIDLNAELISFFDPNHGEWTFEDTSSFKIGIGKLIRE